MDLQTLINRNFVRDLIHDVCGDETEVIERPAAYFVRNVNEDDRKVERIIILPPRGFTANTPDQMNSHDEAESATIEIKGAVKPDRASFSIQKDCVFIASVDKNDMVSDLSEPYLTYDVGAKEDHVQTSFHSAGTAPFYVVRNNGYGFYHNIVNVSDDWLVLKLVKTLRPQKSVDLEKSLAALPLETAKLLRRYFESVIALGDEIYTKAFDTVEAVSNMPLDQSLPALAEMLYVHDTGKHEACSVFATILRIGKQQPTQVTEFLKKAMQENALPTYYGGQLVEKIAKTTQKQKPLYAVRAG